MSEEQVQDQGIIEGAAEQSVPQAPEEKSVIFFDGQEIVEKLEDVNEEGRLCKLLDGSTVRVPLATLGE